MEITDMDKRCEVCEESASYRPQFNQTLCVQHFKELVSERMIHLSTTKNIKYLADHLLREHKITFSKQKVLDIIQASVTSSLAELESD